MCNPLFLQCIVCRVSQRCCHRCHHWSLLCSAQVGRFSHSGCLVGGFAHCRVCVWLCVWLCVAVCVAVSVRISPRNIVRRKSGASGGDGGVNGDAVGGDGSDVLGLLVNTAQSHGYTDAALAASELLSGAMALPMSAAVASPATAPLVAVGRRAKSAKTTV